MPRFRLMAIDSDTSVPRFIQYNDTLDEATHHWENLSITTDGEQSFEYPQYFIIREA